MPAGTCVSIRVKCRVFVSSEYSQIWKTFLQRLVKASHIKCHETSFCGLQLTHTHTHTHIYTHTHILVCVYIYRHTYIYIYITHTHIYTHIYIHTHTHTPTHTHTHTHTHINGQDRHVEASRRVLSAFGCERSKIHTDVLVVSRLCTPIYFNVFKVILNSSLINAAAGAALSNRPITEFEFNRTTRTNETGPENKKNHSNNRHLPSKYIRAKMELADCTQWRLNAVGPVQ